jgi:NADPH:quinone reductase-like Zn-dependent oxidoreductase
MPRTLVLDGPRQLRLSEQPSRPLRAGEVRLRAFVAPPAGSVAAYPVTLGYEMVSEVVEVAPDVTAVRVGDLVHTGTPHQEDTVLDVLDEHPLEAVKVALAY